MLMKNYRSQTCQKKEFKYLSTEDEEPLYGMLMHDEPHYMYMISNYVLLWHYRISTWRTS